MRCMMFIKHPRDYAGQQAPAALYGAMGKFVIHWPEFEGESELRPLEDTDNSN